MDGRAVRQAANMVRRFWKRAKVECATKAVVRRYFEVGPTKQRLQTTSFHEMVPFLRTDEVLQASKNCMKRILHLCALTQELPESFRGQEFNIRVFVASYMIVLQPSHVFESIGAVERELIDSGNAVVSCWEDLCQCLRDGPRSHDSLATFPTLLETYYEKFRNWKVPDEAKLVLRIRHALSALYAARHHLPPDEPADSRLLLEFNTQIVRLTNKLRQIGGQAQVDEMQARLDAGEFVMGVPPAIQQGYVAPRGTALPERMDNEQLAHELLLDPAFEINDAGTGSEVSPVAQRIRDTYCSAFFNSIADDLALSPPAYTRVLRVLDECAIGIDDLFGSSVQEKVPPLRQRVVAEASLSQSWECVCETLCAFAAECKERCAPRREAQIAAGWAALGQLESTPLPEMPRRASDAARFLLDCVNWMRVDAANARLRLIRPVVEVHGVAYAQGKFRERLDAGAVELDSTRAWVRRAVDHCFYDDLDGLVALTQDNTDHFRRVFQRGLVDLVFAPEALGEVPATLLHDLRHLVAAQNEARYLVTSIASMVALYNSLDAGFDDIMDEPDRLQALSVCMPPVRDYLAGRRDVRLLSGDSWASVVDEVERVLAGTGAFVRPECIPHLTTCVRGFADLGCGAHAVISTSLEVHLRRVLAAVTYTDDMHTAPLAEIPPFRISRHAGRAFLDRIEDLSRCLARVAQVNFAVHKELYRKLAAQEAARSIQAAADRCLDNVRSICATIDGAKAELSAAEIVAFEADC
jgi:hypothetical protein